jgi:hypothetical protein
MSKGCYKGLGTLQLRAFPRFFVGLMSDDFKVLQIQQQAGNSSS